MTWLPVAQGEAPGYEAVLGLLPEQWENLREVHAAAWAMTDPELLELCRLRIAQTLGCSEYAGWQPPGGLRETESAALSYVDQFLLDCNAVTREMNEGLERRLGTR